MWQETPTQEGNNGNPMNQFFSSPSKRQQPEVIFGSPWRILQRVGQIRLDVIRAQMELTVPGIWGTWPAHERPPSFDHLSDRKCRMFHGERYNRWDTTLCVKQTINIRNIYYLSSVPEWFVRSNTNWTVAVGRCPSGGLAQSGLFGNESFKRDKRILEGEQTSGI